MSKCIMHMRHRSQLIINYMGKLRFTLTNVLFWIVLLLSCFLSENFAILNSNPLNGFSLDSAYRLTVSAILLLVLYYFLEHKKNGLTFDKILLPSLAIAALFLIWTVFRYEKSHCFFIIPFLPTKNKKRVPKKRLHIGHLRSRSDAGAL